MLLLTQCFFVLKLLLLLLYYISYLIMTARLSYIAVLHVYHCITVAVLLYCCIMSRSKIFCDFIHTTRSRYYFIFMSFGMKTINYQLHCQRISYVGCAIRTFLFLISILEFSNVIIIYCKKWNVSY